MGPEFPFTENAFCALPGDITKDALIALMDYLVKHPKGKKVLSQAFIAQFCTNYETRQEFLKAAIDAG